MKRMGLVVVVSLFLALIGVNVSYAAGENLVSNPSMELKSGRWPTDWSYQKKGNNITIFGYDSAGFDGNKSVSMRVNKYVAGEAFWTFKPVAVVAGKSYTYSGYYKATMPTKLYAKVKLADGSETKIQLLDVAAATSWTKLTADILMPANAQTITVVQSITAVGSVSVDNVSLVEKAGEIIDPDPVPDPVDPSNPIPNYSLEEVSSNAALPAHWSSVKTGNNNARFTYLNTGHTGNKSLKVEISQHTSGLAYYRFDSAPVTGGGAYDFSFYHQSDAYSEIDAEITLDNGEVLYQYLGVSYPSSDWSKFSARINLPKNAKSISVYSILYSKGTIVTDDYSLKPVNIIPLKRPIVSFTYDDFFNSMYDTVLPMYKEHGFSGTIYLTTKDFNAIDTMSPEKIQEMHDYGFEIGAHTVNHPHLPFLSSAEAGQEILKSKNDIKDFSGITANSFATPYGEYNDEIKAQIGAYFRSHRSVDVGYNTKDNFDILNIKAMSANNTISPETVLGWVDEAVRQNAWLVIVYHDIVENGGLWTNTPAHMETVLDGVSARGVNVKTVNDAIDEILPQI